MKRRSWRMEGALVAAMLSWPLAAHGQEAVPEGPSSLRETYRDWQVACVRREEAERVCAMSQTLVQQEGGRRILALEITTGADDEAASGTFVLPFGLAIDDGIMLALDEEALGEPLRFRTCLPGGCIVPTTFAHQHLDSLRNGQNLKVTATTSDTGQPVSFALSLAGFSAAFNRLLALAE